MTPDIATFQAELNSNLSRFLDEEFSSYQKISAQPDIHSILRHIKTVSHGGKRLRPFLVWCLYKQSNPEAEPQSIISLLLAIELFHIFCLIHDDVMDEAIQRHGVPTLQAHAAQTIYDGLTQGNRVSDNQAILAGDIVFNSVFKLLHRFNASMPSTAFAILEIFHTLIDEVCIGQMIDIHMTAQPHVRDEDITEKNKLKTAYYSFARPLHVGVLVANRPELLEFVLAFGEQVGLLYQMQDDLLDISGNPLETKKPLFQDVIQNQHTMLSNYVRASSPLASTTLDSFVGKTLTSLDAVLLQKLFINSGALSYGEKLIEDTLLRASQLIVSSELSLHDQNLFKAILNLLIKRTS